VNPQLLSLRIRAERELAMEEARDAIRKSIVALQATQRKEATDYLIGQGWTLDRPLYTVTESRDSGEVHFQDCTISTMICASWRDYSFQVLLYKSDVERTPVWVPLDEMRSRVRLPKSDVEATQIDCPCPNCQGSTGGFEIEYDPFWEGPGERMHFKCASCGHGWLVDSAEPTKVIA
jgi:hypothetical protein